MIYTIDDAGIHFIVEPAPLVVPEFDPIPLDEAVRTCQRIAAENRAALELCECRTQGAPSLCGACE
jgi:hypothetical protein